MSNLWDRFKWCWFWLWNPSEFTRLKSTSTSQMKLTALINSPIGVAVKRAVTKSSLDVSWTSEDFEAKRKEAIEWTMHYFGSAPVSRWEVYFLIEWFVGEAKGKL
jgi:hypothetical protein